MPRPRKRRRVGFEPDVTYFKPAGVRKSDLEESILSMDELEAIRLKDLLSLDQESAAKKMGVSQPTFHRLVMEARRKVADAIVGGKALKIEGGNFKMIRKRKFLCSDCDHVWELEYGTGKPAECPECRGKDIHRHPDDRGPQRGRGNRSGRA